MPTQVQAPITVVEVQIPSAVDAVILPVPGFPGPQGPPGPGSTMYVQTTPPAGLRPGDVWVDSS